MTDQQKRIYWNRNWQFLKGFEESIPWVADD